MYWINENEMIFFEYKTGAQKLLDKNTLFIEDIT